MEYSSYKARRVASRISSLKWSSPLNLEKQVAQILDEEYGRDEEPDKEPVRLEVSRTEFGKLLRALNPSNYFHADLPQVYVIGDDGVARDPFTAAVRK